MVRLPDQDAEVEQRCQCPGKHGDPERVGKQDEPGQGRVVVGGIFVGKVHLGQVGEGSGNRCKEVFQLADPRKVFASDAPQRPAASRSLSARQSYKSIYSTNYYTQEQNGVSLSGHKSQRWRFAPSQLTHRRASGVRKALPRGTRRRAGTAPGASGSTPTGQDVGLANVARMKQTNRFCGSFHVMVCKS